MLGSLTFYRRVLHENFFSHPNITALTPSGIQVPAIENTAQKLPTVGHGIAGVMAGWTVSFIAAPVEHIKARLQIQYAADTSKRLYSGPIDCSKKIVSHASQ
jgi:solute carrier family 25 carnitine/acylcarnitine transporter 20/29